MYLDVQRLNRILDYIYSEIKKTNDKKRDLPMSWSIRHMYSTVQLAVLTGMKTGLDPDLCGIIAAFHDIATIFTGNTEDHAKKAVPFIEEIISVYNKDLRFSLRGITKEEKEIIIEAVIKHGKKKKKSNNPYVEMMKSVDSFDHFLEGLLIKDKELKHLDYMFNLFGIKYILD
jgi:5'-deoxynucleotidase YfbR-like HD superfamily hydrolase